jgi:hypothetical protein
VETERSVRLVEIRARVDAIYEAIVRPGDWLGGVPHLQALDPRSAGGPDGLGARYALQVGVPGLPPLRWELETVLVRRPHLVEWRVEGGLRGEGRWELQQRGSVTDVRSCWQVAPRRPALRVAAVFASAVVAYEHDAILRSGLERLAHHVGGELVSYRAPRHRRPPHAVEAGPAAAAPPRSLVPAGRARSAGGPR